MILKRKETKVFAGLLALLLMAVIFTAGKCALAEQSYDTVTAQLSPQFTIIIDGAERDFYNADGNEVHPIVYQGTTYLPLRAIGELMNKNVNWDQSTLTVTLSGNRNGETVSGIRDTSARETDVSVQLRYDFTIVVDGIKRTFTDVNGNTVYPILYEGSTYLPLRAIGNLMNKTVGWNEATETVTLSSPENGSLVTDADSFYQTGSNNNQQPQSSTPSSISGSAAELEQAKAAALRHAGVSEADAVFVKTKTDRENGVLVYDLEFICGNVKYEYEVEAQTGEIRSFDKETQKTGQSGTGTANTSPSAKITLDEAKQIAVNHAGLSASAVSFRDTKLDFDGGRLVYEIEFISGNQEYEYEISAQSGEVVKYDKDRHD